MLLGNLMYRLISSKEFSDELRSDRSLIPIAIEESLRLEPPVLFLFRTAQEEISLSGVTIKPGDRVVAGIASANRDESVYPDSSTFSLHREQAKEHIAFGAGPHLCIGNNMARMEGAVVLESLVDRYPFGALTFLPDFVHELMPHFLEYGPERLEVVVSR
jgi:cytochrome P450